MNDDTLAINDGTLAGCIQSFLNFTPKNTAEHDELAHSQQRASQHQYDPLYNNCSTEQAADSNDTVTTSAKTLWRVDIKASHGGKKSYVATVMLDKSDSSVQAVFNAINAAMDKGFKELGSNWTCNHYPLHDGDKETPTRGKPENYRGKYYLYARSCVQPIIADAKGNLLQDSEKVHVSLPASQYEGPVSMRFSPYDRLDNSGKQNTGVSCHLRALMAVNPVGHLIGDSASAFIQDVFSKFLKR